MKHTTTRAAITLLLALAGHTAWAADDAMKKDAMAKKEAMAKDGMKGDAMKKDKSAMARKDDMKGEMKSEMKDAMKAETMPMKDGMKK